MSWNYVICKVANFKGEEYEETVFEIREAYYNTDGSIWAVTEHPASFISDDLAGVAKNIEWLRQSLDREVIDLDTYIFATADFRKDVPTS